jgi:hypothetical protein
MNEIKCSVEGCTKIIKTDGVFHPNATYTCLQHTNLSPDSLDRPRFQSYQFDPALARKGKHRSE